jgi:hypothetical protein
MRYFIFSIFAFLFFNTSSAQLAGTWKGKYNSKPVTLVLTDAPSDKYMGSYKSEHNNYELQLNKTDNGFDGRGKDRTAGVGSTFTASVNDKNEMSLTILTVWADQRVEEKVVLKKD